MMTLRTTVLLAVVWSSFPPGVLAQGNREFVTTTALNVRSGPSVDSLKLFVVPAGDTVQAGRCSAGWCLIAHGAAIGWASERYLLVPGAARPEVKPPVDPKVVFWEIVQFQDEAMCEATRLYPDDVHKMAEYSTKGSVEAYKVVGRKYGMTADEAHELVYDAVTATGSWPMPPFPCRLK